jgi:two-component system, chemotaxis family, protein-glutamate methylesterase/glutaminase
MKTAIIIDDAQLMRVALERLLTASGEYRVLASCKNGQEGVAAVLQHAPDVVLVDIEMPILDGLGFLQHARIKTRAQIAVLSAATELGTETARRARSLGADAILEKPSGSVSPDLIQRAGARILGALSRICS